jgi:hypothetical protein
MKLNSVLWKAYDNNTLKNYEYFAFSSNQTYTFQAAVDEVFSVQLTYTWDYHSTLGSGIETYIENYEYDVYSFKVVSTENATLHLYDDD